MNWETVKLGDISSNIQTGPFGSQLHQSDYSEVGTPVVMPKDLIDGHISESSIARVSVEHVERLNRHKIESGDILYSRRGDVGRCAYASDKEVGWLCGTGCLRVSVNPEVANSKFVFYQLQKPETVGWVINHAVGATMLNLNTSILSAVPLELPSLDIQNHAVDMLSAYDYLIENNQRQIKLLEEAAQRLYKEWFIDLHFPGYEDVEIVNGVPEGWTSLYLGEAISYEIGGGWGEESITGNNEHEAYVIRGTDFDGLKNGEFLNIPLRFHTESNLSARMLQHGDIIFEVSGGSRTEGVARTVRIVDSMLKKWKKPVMCASFCKLVRPLNDEISQYLFDHLRYLRAEKITEEFDKRSASSIVNYRWKDFLSQRTLLYPDKSVLGKYNSIAVPLYEKIMTLSLQIESAKASRDRLLPKLMSGEIEL